MNNTKTTQTNNYLKNKRTTLYIEVRNNRVEKKFVNKEYMR